MTVAAAENVIVFPRASAFLRTRLGRLAREIEELSELAEERARAAERREAERVP